MTGTVSVVAISDTANEGSQASFEISGSNLPPGGVTVYYETTAGTATEGTDYTGLSGSVYLSPMAGPVSVNVSTLDDGVTDPGETFSLTLTSVTGGASIAAGSAAVTITETGGPPQGPFPEYIVLGSPGTIGEGQGFTLGGTVSPPASYHLVGTIDWGGFVTYAGSAVDLWTNTDGSFTIPNVYFDDGVSPGNGTASDVATIVIEVASGGSQLSAQTTATVQNVAPTGDFDLVVDTAIGGPEFGLTGIFYDPGLSDVHTVTIDWGDGSEPTIFTQAQSEQFTRHHTYPRLGETYTVEVTVSDDDLGQITWDDEAPMYLLDLDNDANNNGEIAEDDDPIEHILPGAYVGVNGDDDDDDGLIDMSSQESPPIQNENDLEEFHLRWSPADRPDAGNYEEWFVGLFVTPDYAYDPYLADWLPTGAAIYGNDDKSDPIPFVQTPDGPAALWSAADAIDEVLYLEARATGTITLELRLLAPDAYYSPDADQVLFTAFNVVNFDINVKIAAFIPQSKGVDLSWDEPPFELHGYKWALEPGQVTTNRYFSTDNREEAGQQGTSRLSSIGTFNSADIGKFEAMTADIFTTDTGDSHRVPVVEANGELTAKKAEIETKKATPSSSEERHDSGNKKVSTVKVTASAAYPFVFISPAIDYTIELGFWRVGNTVRVLFHGLCDNFPAYEIVINGDVIHEWYPTDPGPTISNLTQRHEILGGASIEAP